MYFSIKLSTVLGIRSIISESHSLFLSELQYLYLTSYITKLVGKRGKSFESIHAKNIALIDKIAFRIALRSLARLDESPRLQASFM